LGSWWVGFNTIFLPELVDEPFDDIQLFQVPINNVTKLNCGIVSRLFEYKLLLFKNSAALIDSL
jgi:hypothetical protein